MSSYNRNYVPWNKSGSSSYSSGTTKKEASGGIPKFDSNIGRTRINSISKSEEDKPVTSRIGPRYGTLYSSGIPRETTSSTSTSSTGFSGRSDTSRAKPILNKKDTSHPPVTYRPLARTGARSRDPSPIDKIEKSSSSNYDLNKLYSRPYQRSVSRERTDSTSSTSTIPKYTGRGSISKDEVPRYTGRSRDDGPKYTRRPSLSKDDPPTKYKIASRATSREDLSTGSQKYINSRFLPKNTIEKSNTAYTRPSAVRTHETSKRNKELLDTLHAQEHERLSRPTSRGSSVAPEDITPRQPISAHVLSERLKNEMEMQTITVISRGTSPTQTSQPSLLKSRRLEIAKVVEKQVSRPKKPVHSMVDKAVQSDRLDDPTKVTRYSAAPRTSSAPWSSFLDMKFSSPNSKKSLKNDESPKNLSRASSTKSLVQSSSSKTDNQKDEKKPSPPAKSKIIPPKQIEKKQLPPQIPKSESPSKSTSLHSFTSTNKDFRKSVLNMNPEGKSTKKFGRRSNSVSSAESDTADPDATDVSENLASCKSYHDSCTSKLPQKYAAKSLGNRRSPSSEASTTTTSGSEDDSKTKKSKKKCHSVGSSRTSVILSSADELSIDKSPKPPQSPRLKGDGVKSEAEAKSFLMRALAPVTNLFKTKNVGSMEKVNWMGPAAEDIDRVKQSSSLSNVPKLIPTEIVIHEAESQEHEQSLGDNSVKSRQSQGSEPISAKIVIRRIEPGRASDNSQGSENKCVAQAGKSSPQPERIRHIPSGEIPWWLDDSAEIPEGIETYPNWVREDGTTTDGRVIYKVRKNDSGETSWWLSSSEKTNEDSSKNKSNIMDSEYLEKHQIRHIDSGERDWWLTSSENIPEMVEAKTAQEMKPKYAIRHQDSGEEAWWLQPETQVAADDDNELEYDQMPLGDRASPEGLEMPKQIEGRQSPYDNIPDTSNRVKRPSHLFISRHTNIDDVLGGSTQMWSSFSNKTYGYDNDNIEQGAMIDAAQVIIHESSPHRISTQKSQQGNVGTSSKTLESRDKCARNAGVAQSESERHHVTAAIAAARYDSGATRDAMSLTCRVQYLNDIDPFSYTTNFPDPSRPPLHTFSATLPLINQLAAVHRLLKSPHRLDDAALQLYKDGDYGSYLDLEASISEQQEEFEDFQSNKKNSIVLRTQLSVRVHTIIEKLLTSEGRELRRALFSLKQIFQEDKDLVHEFVQNDGLSCLIKVGSEADQNYQNYILRALGQVMLYVDGMNGVMDHNQTVQWLYTLIASKFRLVVKTALKLLLVFVEYTDSNCALLIKAVHHVDYSQALLPFHNIMRLLKDFDSADTELLIYAMTLVNKVLNGVPDQDTYYDQADALEEQGLEAVIQRYMSKPGTDLDLLQQFQIYEAVLQYEDGEEVCGTPIRHLDEGTRKTIRNRKSLAVSSERRKSRRHSTGDSPMYPGSTRSNGNLILLPNRELDDEESSSSQSSGLNNSQLNGSYKDSNKAIDAGVTPALKRRRERAERQRSFMKEQESAAFIRGCSLHEENNNENENGNYTNAHQQRISNGNGLTKNSSRKDLTPLMNAVNKLDLEEKQPWIYSMMKDQELEGEPETTNENERDVLLQLKRENTVKDLTQKLANQNILHSPSEENKISRIGDMSGLISKAKEGLAKSKSKADMLKSPTNETVPKAEPKKSENELRWEELVANIDRSLNLCDMDFTDLGSDDEVDVLAPATVTNGIPPPPPPLGDLGRAPPPPPLANRIPPPVVPSPPIFGTSLNRLNKPTETKIPIKKNKKTVKLFWKEVREDPISHVKLKTGVIWDELSPVMVDTQKLEHLFESRAKDLITKKQQEMNKNKEIIVLDPKRSNAINIGMTKLPPPRSIKTAILKMDATIMNREGIEKLLTMLPTEEERTKIQEAQAANPDLPLGSAEQFLLTLASISELPARLKLWAFKLDFEISEREIAEPLMDLKQGIELLRVNKTFRAILSTLLSIGNFLNGNEVKGFQIEYLAKVPEVKDTVHKHSLLHHLCHIVMEKFPDASDLYSEIGAITRASKIDFDELALNIQRLEADCKASWDHLKLIAKHDGSTMMKVKMSDFLSECAERIILLGIIHRRIINRFHKFLLWLGIPLHQISESKPNEFCRVVSEFALEYRTTRERVLQQLEKKANHRERNKTRGKMITDMGKFNKSKEDKADAELRQLLGSDISDVESMQGTLPWRRTRRESNRSFMCPGNGNLTDGDDEILESLVKTATKGSSRTAPRERKRTRHADRKSLRRTLKNGLSEEEQKHLSAYIKGY